MRYVTCVFFSKIPGNVNLYVRSLDGTLLYDWRQWITLIVIWLFPFKIQLHRDCNIHLIGFRTVAIMTKVGDLGSTSHYIRSVKIKFRLYPITQLKIAVLLHIASVVVKYIHLPHCHQTNSIYLTWCIRNFASKRSHVYCIWKGVVHCAPQRAHRFSVSM